MKKFEYKYKSFTTLYTDDSGVNEVLKRYYEDGWNVKHFDVETVINELSKSRKISILFEREVETTRVEVGEHKPVVDWQGLLGPI
ncbi:MAG: hypothetical protein ACOC2U_00260 [bacterium]